MTTDIELRHLRYFAAVAEERHFGRAAVRLGMSQPPLSQAIRQLEERLGHALFVRTTRGVALTAAGRTLRERADLTLAKFEEDLELTRRVGRGELGALTVGFTGSVVLTALPAALGEYRRRYPAVELRLRELVTSTQLEALFEGRLDIGLLRDPGERPGLAREVLRREEFRVLLPTSHPRAADERLVLATLREEPFVLFPRTGGPEAYDLTIGVGGAAGFVPRVVQEAPQWLTIARLVEAGLGVSLAPAGVANLAPSGIVCRPLRGAGEDARTQIVLGWRRGELTPTARAFAEVLREVYDGSAGRLGRERRWAPGRRRGETGGKESKA